jgi:bifunctional UDP-N-acetylglucosamine pyrophosphorylase / glucosamine-1-phosphate N-acetyltransferase
VNRLLLIPAAGTGSRLGAHVPKLLVPVNGRPMIDHLLTLYAPHAEHAIVIASPAAKETVSAALQSARLPVTVVVQEKPTGMLDAVLLARRDVQSARPRRILITWCDQVAIAPTTVDAVASAAASTPEPALVMPTCAGEHPYVHLERDATGRIVEVLHRREGDAMPAFGESDAGVFDLSRHAYLEWLPQYAAAPAIGARTGERNFVPFVSWVAARGTVITVPCSEPEEAVGINTPQDLERLEAHLRARSLRRTVPPDLAPDRQ